MGKFMRPVCAVYLQNHGSSGCLCRLSHLSTPPTHMHMYMLIENPKWFDLSLLYKPGFTESSLVQFIDTSHS